MLLNIFLNVKSLLFSELEPVKIIPGAVQSSATLDHVQFVHILRNVI